MSQKQNSKKSETKSSKQLTEIKREILDQVTGGGVVVGTNVFVPREIGSS